MLFGSNCRSGVVSSEHPDEAVIGRNVLNRLRVWLDGPGSVLRISED